MVAAGMADILPWIATAATVTAAFMTASNLGARITGYGFAFFLLGSICWLAVGLASNQPALLWTNAVLALLNIFGIWRWLGRQAKVEEGTKAASEESQAFPGETLFPVSMLTHAAVIGRNGQLGTCVDAMAGSESGRVAYVGISEGGVAGVGETLRRMPWKDIQLNGDTFLITISKPEFDATQTFEKDSWPAR